MQHVSNVHLSARQSPMQQQPTQQFTFQDFLIFYAQYIILHLTPTIMYQLTHISHIHIILRVT